MNPSECPNRDWGLYYNNTYMLHAIEGVVQVISRDRSLYIRKGNGQWNPTDHNHLECLWPRGRAINVSGQALFIGRQARREARRSITMHHFSILWPGTSVSGMINDVQMNELCFPSEYPSMGYVLRAFKQGERRSVAVTASIILCSRTNGANVIFKGEDAGNIEFTPNQHIFTPRLDCPLSKRALFRLQKEGILCL